MLWWRENQIAKIKLAYLHGNQKVCYLLKLLCLGYTMKSSTFSCNKEKCVWLRICVVLLTGIQEEACSYAERVGRNQRHYVPIKQRTQRGKLQTGAEIPGRANLTSKRSWSENQWARRQSPSRGYIVSAQIDVPYIVESDYSGTM